MQWPATPLHSIGLTAIVVSALAGCAPTASTDQYGVRRIAYGLLETLLASSVSLDLPSAVQAASQLQPIPVSEQQQQQVGAAFGCLPRQAAAGNQLPSFSILQQLGLLSSVSMSTSLA